MKPIRVENPNPRQDFSIPTYDLINRLKVLQTEKNNRELWETDNDQKEKISTKQDDKYGSSILGQLQQNYYPSDIDVYAFGKNGFEFVSTGFQAHGNVKALPACEDYFYRDWKRDGICVKNTDIFIKRAFAIISPESVKEGDYEDSGMIDNDEGLRIGTSEDVARYLSQEGAMEFSGCPPGSWYETEFSSNPDDERQEKTSYHIYNADAEQEKEIFKHLFPGDWKKHCPGI